MLRLEKIGAFLLLSMLSLNSFNLTSLRLIYLWAFIESGIGGVMHLFHIPITGFVVGGFSILINTLLAVYTKSNLRMILTALVLVLLVKFSLSPYSPPGAYIAVAFQGLLGGIIFKVFGIHRWSILLYSGIVMLENAVQKPIMFFLFIEKNTIVDLYNQTNSFIHSLFNFENGITALSLIYILIHLLWGILIAYITWEVIRKLEHYKIPSDFKFDHNLELRNDQKNYQFKKIKLLFLCVFFLIFILGYNKFIIGFYLIRILVLVVFFTIVFPFILSKILSYYKRKNQKSIIEISNQFPKIKSYFNQSFLYTKKYTGIKRAIEFVFLALYLNIIYTENEH